MSVILSVSNASNILIEEAWMNRGGDAMRIRTTRLDQDSTYQLDQRHVHRT